MSGAGGCPSGGVGSGASTPPRDDTTSSSDGAFLLQLLRNPPRARLSSQSSSSLPSAPPPRHPSPSYNLFPDPAAQSSSTSFPFLPHSFVHSSPPSQSSPVLSGFSHPSQWVQTQAQRPTARFTPSPPSSGGFMAPPTLGHQREPGFQQWEAAADLRRNYRFQNRDGGLAEQLPYNALPNNSRNSNSLMRNQNQRSAVVDRLQNHYHQRNLVNPILLDPQREQPRIEHGRQLGSMQGQYKEPRGEIPVNSMPGRKQQLVEQQTRHLQGRNCRLDSYSNTDMQRVAHQTKKDVHTDRRAETGNSPPNVADVEEHLSEIQDESAEEEEILSHGDDNTIMMYKSNYSRKSLLQQDDLVEHMTESLLHAKISKDGNTVLSQQVQTSRTKEARFDYRRGHHISSQGMRAHRRMMHCRYDIDSLSPRFLSVFDSLIPSEEEKAKQKQLLLSLRKLVNKEWPNAQLHVYGSCANSFGVSNCDIDLCLSIADNGMSKTEILLKLADILQSNNLQNIQALTNARVPIVKLMDPITGISCDICINNLLAVVNTKLLRDYAQVDDRLRHLAFIVKHWAKSRAVNETYRGTLSSYAYVLMCINFLQLRRPAILPCLQQMKATYVATVEDTECAYFDHVEKLSNFGAQNNDSIGRLLWGFFHYWAYCHDYKNDVISVRTGRIISKPGKGWTRRMGKDFHLICIEDPFEVSHDLGRVVGRMGINVLREEFERAADILQYDPNPCEALFQPYIPQYGLEPSLDQ